MPLPSDGRCGATPRMLVSSASLEKPSDAGPVNVGFGAIEASPVGLFYTTYVVQANPGGLANTFLDGSAMRVPLAGGRSLLLTWGQLFARPLVTPTSVIFRGTPVPFSKGDNIVSVPLSGGPPATIVALDNQVILNGFATDGRFVYFSTAVGIQGVPLTPYAGTTSIFTVSAGQPANVIGAVGSHLIVAYPEGEVASLPLPQGAPTVLGTCAPGPTDLDHCGSNLCWLAGVTDIERIDPQGGAPELVTRLTGPVGDAFDVAFDDVDAYVIGTDASGGTTLTLEKVPLGGGSPTVLVRAAGNEGGGSVTVDDECVYWSNAKGIFSLAKSVDGSFDQ